MRDIFKKVGSLFEDPRSDRAYKKKVIQDLQNRKYDNDCLGPEKYIQQCYFANPNINSLYQMGVLSTFGVLKKGYYKLQWFQDKGETHYKIAAQNVGYLIQSMEKFNYFTNKMDFCSTDRIFNLVGLSAGFAFSVDDMLRANIKQSLNGQNKQRELSYMLVKQFCEPEDDYKQENYKGVVYMTEFNTLKFGWNNLLKNDKKKAYQIVYFSKLQKRIQNTFYNSYHETYIRSYECLRFYRDFNWPEIIEKIFVKQQMWDINEKMEDFIMQSAIIQGSERLNFDTYRNMDLPDPIEFYGSCNWNYRDPAQVYDFYEWDLKNKCYEYPKYSQTRQRYLELKNRLFWSQTVNLRNSTYTQLAQFLIDESLVFEYSEYEDKNFENGRRAFKIMDKKTKDIKNYKLFSDLNYYDVPNFYKNFCLISGELSENQSKSQQSWTNLSQKSNINKEFMLLISLFKRNYDQIIEQDSFFMENYANDARFFQGLLSINGLLQDYGECSYQTVQTAVSGLLSNIPSRTNVKSTSEILSHFLYCNDGVPQLSTMLDVDQELLKNFFELSLDASKAYDDSIEVFFKNLKLSKDDQLALIDIQYFYSGVMENFRDMYKFSSKLHNIVDLEQQMNDQFNKYEDYESGEKYHQILTWKKGTIEAQQRLLSNFSKEVRHQVPHQQWNQYNLFKKIYLSPDEERNDSLILQILWRIAASIGEDLLTLKDEHRDDLQDHLAEKKEKLWKSDQDQENQFYGLRNKPKIAIQTLICSLIDQDFSCLIFPHEKLSDIENLDIEEQYMFLSAKDLKLIDSTGDLEIIRQMALLQPDKIKDKKSLDIEFDIDETIKADDKKDMEQGVSAQESMIQEVKEKDNDDQNNKAQDMKIIEKKNRQNYLHKHLFQFGKTEGKSDFKNEPTIHNLLLDASHQSFHFHKLIEQNFLFKRLDVSQEEKYCLIDMLIGLAHNSMPLIIKSFRKQKKDQAMLQSLYIWNNLNDITKESFLATLKQFNPAESQDESSQQQILPIVCYCQSNAIALSSIKLDEKENDQEAIDKHAEKVANAVCDICKKKEEVVNNKKVNILYQCQNTVEKSDHQICGALICEECCQRKTRQLTKKDIHADTNGCLTDKPMTFIPYDENLFKSQMVIGIASKGKGMGRKENKLVTHKNSPGKDGQDDQDDADVAEEQLDYNVQLPDQSGDNAQNNPLNDDNINPNIPKNNADQDDVPELGDNDLPPENKPQDSNNQENMNDKQDGKEKIGSDPNVEDPLSGGGFGGFGNIFNKNKTNKEETKKEEPKKEEPKKQVQIVEETKSEKEKKDKIKKNEYNKQILMRQCDDCKIKPSIAKIGMYVCECSDKQKAYYCEICVIQKSKSVKCPYAINCNYQVIESWKKCLEQSFYCQECELKGRNSEAEHRNEPGYYCIKCKQWYCYRCIGELFGKPDSELNKVNFNFNATGQDQIFASVRYLLQQVYQTHLYTQYLKIKQKNKDYQIQIEDRFVSVVDNSQIDYKLLLMIQNKAQHSNHKPNRIYWYTWRKNYFNFLLSCSQRRFCQQGDIEQKQIISMQKLEIFEKIVTGHYLIDKMRTIDFTKYIDNFFAYCYNLKHDKSKQTYTSEKEVTLLTIESELIQQQFGFKKDSSELKIFWKLLQSALNLKLSVDQKNQSAAQNRLLISQIVDTWKRILIPMGRLFEKIILNGIILYQQWIKMLPENRQNPNLRQAHLKSVNVEKQTIKEAMSDFLLFITKLDIIANSNNTYLQPIFQESRITTAYESLNALCNVQTKSILDPQFLKNTKLLVESVSAIVLDEMKNFDSTQSTAKQVAGFLDPKVLDCIFGIAAGNIQRMVELLDFTGIDQNKIDFIKKLVSEIQDLGVFGKTTCADLVQQKASTRNDEEFAVITKRIAEGKATSKDLFKAVDDEGDKSGSISKSEFSSLSKRLGMNFTDHRINEIFATLKEDTKNDSQDLNEEEFDQAMKYLQDKNTGMSLEALGISTGIMTIALINLCVILVLLLAFIFVGIEAFALGGAFGSIINSIIPMGAGAGAGGSQDKKSDVLKEGTIQKSVNKTKTIIETNTI